MKNLLLVVGTVSLLAAPVGAEGLKKSSKRPTVAQVDKTVLVAPVVAPVVAPASTEMVALPELPADTSSPLNAFPELESKVEAAAAAKPVKVEKAKPMVMNMGDKYVLGTKRDAAKPTQDVEQIIPKSLSQSQIATVVQSHMGEIQQCWNMIPKQMRADAATVDLKLEVNEAGDVTDIDLGGDVAASAQKCMSSAISHWKFATAETTSDVEYGIALRSL